MESKSEEKNPDIELTQSDISKTRQAPFGEHNEFMVNKDTDSILKNTNESNKKWRLEGVNIVVLSVIVLSTAITIALIFSIIFGQPQVVPQGAVAVDDDFCGQIGLNIMRKNKGNAVDAIVSVMLCLTVTRPDVASLGGCGAVLVRDRNKQLSHLFDFTCPVRNSATERDKPDKNKPASLVGIPSLVRGLAVMHQRFGSLKWSDLFTGAIDLTKNGFKPSKSLIEAANKLRTLNLPDFLKPILNQLIDENTPYSPSVDLHNTLQHLANQRDEYFYNTNENTFNKQFVDYMKQQNSQWSLEDLKNYTVSRPNAIKKNEIMVISNAALFLRGSQCHTPITLRQFTSISTMNNVKEQTSMMSIIGSHSRFTPAIEKNCINSTYSIQLTRIHPNYNNTIPDFINKLKQLNYNIQLLLLPNQWPSRVFLTGWNGYDMITSGDYRSLNSRTLYTF
ncbi:unnamed protein product [Schistosoma intercalatum]|nr:unnamed protein product [Schistosoma intercalatum]